MVKPPNPDMPPFERLVELMRILRAPGGCAWDAKQTHLSLVPYLIEETYELADAIEGGDPEKIKEELGDHLVQFIFHGEIAEETKNFSINASSPSAIISIK
ncbi:MAG: MazG nucleotide pyrophosphohydrolase domain-containing protein, partial [Candidatus Zixiibacteriota bacterium]